MKGKKGNGYDPFILKDKTIDHQLPRSDLLYYRKESQRLGMEIIFSINPCREHDYTSLLNVDSSFDIFLKLVLKSGQHFELKINFNSLREIRSWLRGAKPRLLIFASLFEGIPVQGPLHNRFVHFLKSRQGIFLNQCLKDCLSSLLKMEKPEDKSGQKLAKFQDEKYEHNKTGSGC
jgi:hypothetical protein